MSHFLFYKVPGGHDTKAGSVIWNMTDSRAGGGVACRRPRVSATARRARLRHMRQEVMLERLKRPGCVLSPSCRDASSINGCKNEDARASCRAAATTEGEVIHSFWIKAALKITEQETKEPTTLVTALHLLLLSKHLLGLLQIIDKLDFQKLFTVKKCQQWIKWVYHRELSTHCSCIYFQLSILVADAVIPRFFSFAWFHRTLNYERVSFDSLCICPQLHSKAPVIWGKIDKICKALKEKDAPLFIPLQWNGLYEK